MEIHAVEAGATATWLVLREPLGGWRTRAAAIVLVLIVHAALFAAWRDLSAYVARREPPRGEEVFLTLVEPSARSGTPLTRDLARPAAPERSFDFGFRPDLAPAPPGLESRSAPPPAAPYGRLRILRCRPDEPSAHDDIPPSEQEEVCPPIPDRSAQAAAAGLDSIAFLDSRLAPRTGPPALHMGPVTASLSIEGQPGLSGSDPALMLRFSLPLPPRED